MSDELDRLAHAVLVAATAGTVEPPPWLRARLARGLGAVCLFGRNVVDTTQVRAFTDRLRDAAADRPDGGLLVVTDEEGGDVTRLHHATGSPHLGPWALGTVDDESVTRATGRSIGNDLAAAGVDWDFAPVADVSATRESPVLGVRSFGSDPEAVARHARATVDGLHDAGVLATVKHFPGHGATSADSHTDLPRVTLTRAELDGTQLVPFAAIVRHGVDAAMVGHLLVEALDPGLPASLSPAAIGLLRRDLGFTGTVVTDALEMRAVVETWTLPHAAVLALRAGADALCLSGDLHDEEVVDAAVRAVVAAVRAGELPADRLAEAAGSVARLRARRAELAGAGAGDLADAAGGVPYSAAARSLRIRGDVALAPGPVEVVVLDPAPNRAAGRLPWHPGDPLVAARPGSALRVLGAEAPGSLPLPANGRGLLLVVRDLHRHPAAGESVAAALAARPDAVVVEFGMPVLDPGGRGWVGTGGASAASVRAVVRLLQGRP